MMPVDTSSAGVPDHFLVDPGPHLSNEAHVLTSPVSGTASTSIQLPHNGSSTPFGDLPRSLGLWDAVALVVGGIIGSGVFFKAATLARDVGAFGPIMLLWVLVGIHTLCATLSLAELAGMLPHAGGPYVYLQAAYGRLAAFLWGWGEFWIIRTASLGALSTASVLAFSEVVPLDRMSQMVLSIAIVLGLSAVNYVATKGGSLIQIVTTGLKLGFLGLLIVLPAFLGRIDTANLDPIWTSKTGLTFWAAMGTGAMAVLWPYDGWINVAPVTEEIRDPSRNVPRARILGVGLVIVVYLLVNVSYHLTLSIPAMQASSGIAADVCQAVFGPWGSHLSALGIMCSTLGATNGNLLCGPRIYFAMARDGVLPGVFAQVHPQFKTPANAIVLQAVWTTVLIVGAFQVPLAENESADAPFDKLTNFAIFGGLVFYALVVAAVLRLRATHPELPRPYRTWGYPWTPLLYLGGSAGVLVSMLLQNWRETLVGSLLILGGLTYYTLVVRTERPRVVSPPPQH